MAKKGRKSRRFNLRKVRVTSKLVLSALAALDVASGALTNVVTNKIRLITADFAYAWANVADIDDGMEFGLAHSDYTSAEIEECLEAGAAFELGDKVAQERANRLVRSIGVMSGSGTDGSGMSFKDGERHKTKLNWLLGEGDSLNIWVRNGSGTIWTTASEIIASGDLWVKD